MADIEHQTDTDITVIDHGSVVGLWPHSEAASVWIAEHVADDAPWLGPCLMVERRYVEAILRGMADDGLVIGGL